MPKRRRVSVGLSHPKKKDIKKGDFDELKYFLYLTFKQMNIIVRLGEQHGDYASLNDLRHIAILNDEILRKIGPNIDSNDKAADKRSYSRYPRFPKTGYSV